jgi:hypothetical protein
MPDQVLVARRVIRTSAGAQLARLESLRVDRTVVQVRRPYLHVPADSIHHKRQDFRIVNQVQKRLVVGQRIPECEGTVLREALLRANPR